MSWLNEEHHIHTNDDIFPQMTWAELIDLYEANVPKERWNDNTLFQFLLEQIRILKRNAVEEYELVEKGLLKELQSRKNS